MALILALVASTALGAILVPIVMRLARRAGAVDAPDVSGRKRHSRPTPLWGGLALFAAIVVVALVARLMGSSLPGRFVTDTKLIALGVGGLILLIGGLIDDRFRLSPARQIAFPVVAAAIAVAGGIAIPYVRNPAGGLIVFSSLAGGAITFVWLLTMTYTTKFLDGLDGLVSGIGAIAAVIILFVALRPELRQPDVAILAAIVAGAALGFLPWNFHPARIFLGEAGSTIIGFTIGALAVIGGSKVATTLLVLGIPLVDAAATILARLLSGARATSGDRRHLHFRLIDSGFSERKAVILFWSLAAAFGLIGLAFSTKAKMFTLAVVFIFAVALIALTAARRKQQPL